MNYIKEINAFYDWLELNDVSPSAINLWYALMHINNKSGWASSFTVAESVLCVKTGLSDRTLRKVRNELKQLGRIDFASRKGKAPKYTINSFMRSENNAEPEQRSEEFSEVSSGLGSEVSSAPSSEVSSALVKHKQNINKRAAEEDARKENPFEIYEQNFGILKPILRDRFIDWCKDLGDEIVIAGMRLAAQKGGRTFDYIEKIWQEWFEAGLETIDQVRVHELEKKNRNKSNVTPFRNRKASGDIDWGGFDVSD